MRRATIQNISAVRTIEDVKRVLIEMVRVMNTTRQTENDLRDEVVELSTFVDTPFDYVSISASSSSNLDPSDNGGFQFVFGG